MHQSKAAIYCGVLVIFCLASFIFVIGEFSATRAAHFQARDFRADRPAPDQVEEEKVEIQERYVAPASMTPPFY